MEIETETHIGTLDLTPYVQMRSRGREIVSKESKIRGGLHLTMDGDRDRDPHWSTGSQDREGYVHPLIQGD